MPDGLFQGKGPRPRGGGFDAGVSVPASESWGRQTAYDRRRASPPRISPSPAPDLRWTESAANCAGPATVGQPLRGHFGSLGRASRGLPSLPARGWDLGASPTAGPWGCPPASPQQQKRAVWGASLMAPRWSACAPLTCSLPTFSIAF